MSDLSAFYAQNVTASVTEEIVVSPRFLNKSGKPIPWMVSSMTEEENESIRKAATRRVKGRNGQYSMETDSAEYLAKLVTASVTFPDLKNAELQKSYGVMGAEALLHKMLLPGEYANLVQKVQELNGFDADMNELVEEVKN
jgi:hypothetical protein